MNRKGYSFSHIIALAIVTITAIACKDARTYDSYKALPINGWERNDTAVFHIPRQWEGMYSMDLGVRASQSSLQEHYVHCRTHRNTQEKKETNKSQLPRYRNLQHHKRRWKIGRKARNYNKRDTTMHCHFSTTTQRFAPYFSAPHHEQGTASGYKRCRNTNHKTQINK